VLVGSPDLVKQVFAADPETLHSGEPNPLGRVIGRNSLFSLDERRHLERRRIVLPPFHGERMRAYESIVEEETLREIESWPEGRERRSAGPMMRITLNIILRAVFGVREGWMMDEMRERVPDAVKLGQRLIGLAPLQRDLGPASPGRRFKDLINRFEWGVNALIDEARAGHARGRWEPAGRSGDRRPAQGRGRRRSRDDGEHARVGDGASAPASASPEPPGRRG
jgi:cytochrome P450